MGVLGMDVVRDFAVRVDMQAGKVRFLRTAPGDSRTGLSIINKPEQSPSVSVRIDGSDEGFILDTAMVGHISGAQRSELFESLLSKDKLQPARRLFVESGAGTVSQFGGRMDEVSAGGFGHRDFPVAKQMENLLGLNYLARYFVTFDISNQIV